MTDKSEIKILCVVDEDSALHRFIYAQGYNRYAANNALALPRKF